MSNTKISALTSATTPLAGTEVLPIVQSSATTKVTVANLTAGRAVSALSLASTTGAAFATTSGNAGVGITDSLAGSYGMKLGVLDTIGIVPTTQNTVGSFGQIKTQLGSSGGEYVIKTTITNYVNSANYGTSVSLATRATTAAIERVLISSAGDVTISSGNVIQGTAAKGVNFTANTPAAGMTSQLLNWYEEGTWTPAQGGGLTVVGAFSSTGRYTRNGRQVFVNGTITGATSVAIAAAGLLTTNLPFTVNANGAGHGNITNAANTAFAAVVCTSTNITAAGAVAATGTITFSATYIV